MRITNENYNAHHQWSFTDLPSTFQLCLVHAGTHPRCPFFGTAAQLWVRPPGHQAWKHSPPPRSARLDAHRLWLHRPDWYAAGVCTPSFLCTSSVCAAAPCAHHSLSILCSIGFCDTPKPIQHCTIRASPRRFSTHATCFKAGGTRVWRPAIAIEQPGAKACLRPLSLHCLPCRQMSRCSEQARYGPLTAESTASLMFSLKYAAPEVVRALEAGSRTIRVDAAVDIWAIGVIAFELLTGERAFPGAMGSEAAAQEAIAGRVPLPWEGRSGVVEMRLRKLRGMRRTVLQCLDRDPAQRPSSEALLQSWDHTFDNMFTRGTEWTPEPA